MSVPPARRIDSIDFIKLAAILAVVVTHSGARYWIPAYGTWDEALRTRWVSFHVPSFLILSGFLYFSASPSSLAEIRRRAGRILWPYLVASAVMFLAGFSAAKNAWGFGATLATGSSLGIYYYVFALFCCLPFMWILSRLSEPQQFLVLGLLVGYQIALMFDPRLAVSAGASKLWSDRDVLGRFYLGYFAIGWLAAAHRAVLWRIYERYRPVILAACAAIVVVWVLAPEKLPGRYWSQGRIVYSLAAVGLVIAFVRDLPAGPITRFLSEGTFTIYLYHRAFQISLYPYIVSWHPMFRIASMVLAGMVGSVAVIWLARLCLGRRRSRLLLGA